VLTQVIIVEWNLKFKLTYPPEYDRKNKPINHIWIYVYKLYIRALDQYMTYDIYNLVYDLPGMFFYKFDIKCWYNLYVVM